MFSSYLKTVAEFISKKGNPYKMLTPNLHNFIPGTSVPSSDTKKVLNCYLHGKEQYGIFRNKMSGRPI